MKWAIKFLLALYIGVLPLLAQTEKISAISASQPREITYCDLSKNPAAYNHELVRLTAFVTYSFEDFHLVDPTCSSEGFSVWVMYGGKAQSGAVYCCPGEGGGRLRHEFLTIEGVEIPLVNDTSFQKLSGLLAKERDTTARVSAVGRFFSGEKQTVNGHTFWGGAGHMGCCSLFVVQQVESFAPHTRGDLDFTVVPGWYGMEGCKFSSLRYVKEVSITYSDGTAQAIAEQKKAESGEARWTFSDPQRVAIESLKPFYPGRVPVLKRVKQTRARQVFRWRNGKNMVVVVVARPYWLSFYAVSDSVAWVTTVIKEAGCQ